MTSDFQHPYNEPYAAKFPLTPTSPEIKVDIHYAIIFSQNGPWIEARYVKMGDIDLMRSKSPSVRFFALDAIWQCEHDSAWCKSVLKKHGHEYEIVDGKVKWRIGPRDGIA